jgi:hypothetical protein
MGRVDGLGRGRGTGGSDFGFGGSEVGAGICAGKGARPKFLALAHAFFFHRIVWNLLDLERTNLIFFSLYFFKTFKKAINLLINEKIKKCSKSEKHKYYSKSF